MNNAGWPWPPAPWKSTCNQAAPPHAPIPNHQATLEQRRFELRGSMKTTHAYVDTHNPKPALCKANWHLRAAALTFWKEANSRCPILLRQDTGVHCDLGTLLPSCSARIERNPREQEAALPRGDREAVVNLHCAHQGLGGLSAPGPVACDLPAPRGRRWVKTSCRQDGDGQTAAVSWPHGRHRVSIRGHVRNGWALSGHARSLCPSIFKSWDPVVFTNNKVFLYGTDFPCKVTM